MEPLLALFRLVSSLSSCFCHLSRAGRPVLSNFRSSDQIELCNNLVAQFVGFTGTLVLNDPLFDKSLSMSKGYGWEDYLDTQGNGCQFTKGGYHAIEQQNYINVCHLSTVVDNFAFEVQMEVIQGNCGGITFRDDTIISAYHFEVCQDGTYKLYRFDSTNSQTAFTSGSSSDIHTGLNQDNVIAVVAIGDKIDVYVNHKQITTIKDNKYQQGHVGLRVVGSAGEVIYTNAKMWQL